MNVEEAKNIIVETFPQFSKMRVELLGEGWDFRLFEVDERWAEHVLINPHSGSVNAIIDWGDTAIGDPAVDFAGLYTWYGESWMKCVFEFTLVH